MPFAKALMLLSQLLYLMPVIGFMIINKVDPRKWMPFKPLKLSVIAMVILYAVLMIPVTSWLNLLSMLFVRNAFESSQSELTQNAFWVNMIVMAVIPPICEEFTFRGLYYNGYVHTGSRNLGKQVAQIYQKLAVKCQSGWAELMEEQNRMIAEYKATGRKNALQDAIRQLHNSFKMRKPTIPPDLSYLEGAYREDYLHDMRLCQHWAKMNRSLIANLIMDYFISQGYVELMQNDLAFESVHNYIGDDNIIRKGAIAAYEGQKCIIPLNMRDGSLICIGKGNVEWNCSAPHGAGRVMSRSQAFKSISMDDYRASMLGIYSESLSEDTKDESPMVYKPKDEIIGNIRDTVSIVNVIKPVYNFKAAE